MRDAFFLELPDPEAVPPKKTGFGLFQTKARVILELLAASLIHDDGVCHRNAPGHIADLEGDIIGAGICKGE
jgi:hypothetical protein